MPFAPGQTGNAGGRKPDSQQMKNARELFRAYTEEAAIFIGRLVKNAGEDTKLRLQAANVILDRAFGKPAVDVHDCSDSQQPQFNAAYLLQLLAEVHKQKEEMLAMEAELKVLRAGKKDDS